MEEPAETRLWPQRLHHETPGGIKAGALFHVRLRINPTQSVALTNERIAPPIISSVEYYEAQREWHCSLFLLMPDHAHALLAFPIEKSMPTVVGNWKRFTARALGIKWQRNFFDHRIRHAQELKTTREYILRNPVVKGLTATETEWLWQWRSNARAK